LEGASERPSLSQTRRGTDRPREAHVRIAAPWQGGEEPPADDNTQMGLRFDRVAELYERVRPAYPEVLLDFATEGRTIRDALEIGCGSGQLTAALATRAFHLQGIEPGTELAALARQRAPGAVVRIGRFEEVSLPAAAFDAVFSATAFHWVDPTIGWAKAARVLRRPGILALLSHVFVADEQARPAQEALAQIYGAEWRIRTQDELIERALERRENISEVWAWLENPAIALPKAARLFGEVRLHAIPEARELSASELLDLQRTTSTHLHLDAAERDRVETEIVGLVEDLGGRYPIRRLAVAAVSERR
jgi:SAM-dependent methyltransferase